MELRGIFQCQNCGATGTVLTQEPVTMRMICFHTATCKSIQELESSNKENTDERQPGDMG